MPPPPFKQRKRGYSGLRFVKINPIDLDLDVVTNALSGPFAWWRGLIAISKNETTSTLSP